MTYPWDWNLEYEMDDNSSDRLAKVFEGIIDLLERLKQTFLIDLHVSSV